MRLKEHRLKWKFCESCDLCHTRTEVVTFRHGNPDDGPEMKTDILFIGEAPGEIEDIEGKPFWGPSGRMLSRMVKWAAEGYPVKWGFTNTVACFPFNDGSRDSRPPTRTEADSCSLRLRECITACRPTLIICVGTTSKKYFPGGFLKASKTFPFVKGIEHIVHPSFILRRPEQAQDTAEAEARLEIHRFISKYFRKGSKRND